jgi:hypothetical protein
MGKIDFSQNQAQLSCAWVLPVRSANLIGAE